MIIVYLFRKGPEGNTTRNYSDPYTEGLHDIVKQHRYPNVKVCKCFLNKTPQPLRCYRLYLTGLGLPREGLLAPLPLKEGKKGTYSKNPWALRDMRADYGSRKESLLFFDRKTRTV